jgi:DUF1009 family protein
MADRTRKLGILAGAGALPDRLINACREMRRDVFVIAFEGIACADDIAQAPHQWAGLGAVNRTIELLHEAGVEDVVLAGAVARPSLRSLRLDRRGRKVLMGLGRGGGDDSLLSLLVKELEGEGFRVVGVDDILTDLRAPLGPIGSVAPDDDANADIAVAARAARALGALDIGQAAVAQQGEVLGVEAAEGTDALLARCAELRREGPGGVLVKLAKQGQERRADLPTIGPHTVDAARRAGLRGIAVEATHSLIVDRAGVAAAADAAGIFVVGIVADGD